MEQKPGGMSAFYEAHTRAFMKYAFFPVQELDQQQQKEILSRLLNGTKPSQEELDRRSPQVKMLEWLVKAFGEIYDSTEYLHDALVYIAQFPYEGTRVTKIRHFCYVRENFLREIYTLDQRLKTFIIEIAQKYEGISENEWYASHAGNIYRAAREKLRCFIEPRHALIHETREVDLVLTRLRRLEHLTLVTFAGKDFAWVFEDNLSDAFQRAIDTYPQQMRQEVQHIESVIDEFFDGVNTIVWDDDGDLVIPSL